jgi:hypothetical protein
MYYVEYSIGGIMEEESELIVKDVLGYSENIAHCEDCFYCNREEGTLNYNCSILGTDNEFSISPSGICTRFDYKEQYEE